MKLYYTPGACSMAPHIALREAGLKFDLEKVDLKEKKTETGAKYLEVNPKGSVPALKRDDGQVMTEVAVVLQYIADQKPDAKLAPKQGAPDRYKLKEWLNFVSSEVHKGLSPMFHPAMNDGWKKAVFENADRRFGYLANHLEKNPYLLGNQYSVADSYLFTILGWTKHFNYDLGKFPVLKAYVDRIAARPAVQAAMKAEGLVK